MVLVAKGSRNKSLYWIYFIEEIKNVIKSRESCHEKLTGQQNSTNQQFHVLSIFRKSRNLILIETILGVVVTKKLNKSLNSVNYSAKI